MFSEGRSGYVLELHQCSVTRNVAEERALDYHKSNGGGGMSVQYSTLKIYQSTVSHNTAKVLPPFPSSLCRL